MNDSHATIQQLKSLVQQFNDERNWGKHHSPRNVAVSIVIEAAELLEHYQWDDYKKREKKSEIAGELADIVIYCLLFANVKDIDVAKAVIKKLNHLAKKYPTRIFNHANDDPKKYWKLKQQLRRKGRKGNVETSTGKRKQMSLRYDKTTKKQ